MARRRPASCPRRAPVICGAGADGPGTGRTWYRAIAAAATTRTARLGSRREAADREPGHRPRLRCGHPTLGRGAGVHPPARVQPPADPPGDPQAAIRSFPHPGMAFICWPRLAKAARVDCVRHRPWTLLVPHQATFAPPSTAPRRRVTCPWVWFSTLVGATLIAVLIGVVPMAGRSPRGGDGRRGRTDAAALRQRHHRPHHRGARARDRPEAALEGVSRRVGTDLQGAPGAALLVPVPAKRGQGLTAEGDDRWCLAAATRPYVHQSGTYAWLGTCP